ncbi:MAG: metal-sulfur cluster assembly factor [Candidatus Pacebacteria bacterium]|nr:metal-sulfur cluster assembly factor [Candidatus Paceibacterota bacterium]
MESPFTIADIYKQLNTILDPELRIGLVDLGLIYDVSFVPIQTDSGERIHIHILMTLTTPGCPLASVFDQMVKDGLKGLGDIDPKQDVTIELTFDPPWVIDMMNPESRAQLGL